MALAFLNLGTSEAVMLLIPVLLIFVAVGHYGRNTILGYSGSILVAILTTPLVAFIIVFILRERRKAVSLKASDSI